MKRFLTRNRQLLTVLLALTGIGITLAYIYCYGACSSLRGDLLGMDLKYLGIFYMSAIIVLALMRKFVLCLLLFAFGAGGEIFLIGYQVRSGIYCPYCLAFAATVFLGLTVNFERARRTLATLAAAAGLVFFLLFFSGAATPAYAAESPLPAFGAGPVQVRIYTDYFCGPCRAEEAEVIALVTELVEKNLVRVLFIDTPVHQETILYAGYFLAIMNANREFGRAVAARAALFEAAEKKIGKKEALEAFLKKKGLSFLTFDTAPVFKIYGNYLKEDQIRATPTFVIMGPDGKKVLTGSDKIQQGLRDLLRSLPGPA